MAAEKYIPNNYEFLEKKTDFLEKSMKKYGNYFWFEMDDFKNFQSEINIKCLRCNNWEKIKASNFLKRKNPCKKCPKKPVDRSQKMKGVVEFKPQYTKIMHVYESWRM